MGNFIVGEGGHSMGAGPKADGIVIARATREDAPAIHTLLRALSRALDRPHDVRSTPDDIARYGFGQAVSWTEEVPRYLLIWISFLAAAVGVLNRDHVGFDVLFNALTKWVETGVKPE